MRPCDRAGIQRRSSIPEGARRRPGGRAQEDRPPAPGSAQRRERGARHDGGRPGGPVPPRPGPGRGYVRQQGRNSWAIVICLGRDPETGKEKHKWHTIRGTKKDAERDLAMPLRQVDRGTYVEPTRLAVREFLERWLRDVG